jgi:hypothetical protein
MVGAQRREPIEFETIRCNELSAFGCVREQNRNAAIEKKQPSRKLNSFGWLARDFVPQWDNPILLKGLWCKVAGVFVGQCDFCPTNNRVRLISYGAQNRSTFELRVERVSKEACHEGADRYCLARQRNVNLRHEILFVKESFCCEN